MNKFYLQIISSIFFIVFALTGVYFDKSNNLSYYFAIVVAIGCLVYSIVSFIRYKKNKEYIDNELAKEFDERDELIDGKVSRLTLTLTTLVSLFIMLLSNFVKIPANNALFLVILSGFIIEIVSRKYYENIF